MDGKRLIAKVLAAGAVAGAVGCSTPMKTASSPAVPQLPGGAESRFAKLFAPKPPGPVTPQYETVDAKPKVTSLKPETDIAFADVQVDAAFMEDQPTATTNRMLDEARQRYQKVLAKEPQNVEATRGLARLYTRTGDRDRANQSYDTLMRANPKDHKLIYEYALACGRFDDWAGATASCEKALAQDPENRRYYRTYGVCLARTGNYEKAFDVMLKVSPEAEARYSLAKVLMDNDQAELGKQQMQLALQADPNFGPVKEWFASVPAAPQAGVSQVGFQPK